MNVRLAMLSVLLTAWAVFPQNGSQLKDWNPVANEIRVNPKSPCGDLRGLTGYGYSVSTAIAMPATAEAPEHCRVSGQILPEVRFEVNLPSAWNRRLYMFGNGGFAGEPFEAQGRVSHRNRALRSGFAVAATDTGHDASAEPLATFAVSRQKLLDYAYRAVHVTAETAKQLVRAYYGAPQARAYFDGCSTGGRQGLILAQRFPNDFDGIVVGAPVLDFSSTMISYAWIAQALAAAPIPSAKLKILAERVYEQCDGKDGLKDGLIDDPRKCAFEPSRDLPKCSGESDGADCFTAKQIGALEKIYGDIVGQGRRLFPGWPVGAEVAGANGRSGWEGWLVRDDARTISVSFGETFFRYMGFPEKDANYDLSRFDFDRDPGRMTAIRQVLDATEPDLSSFRSRGGRIVMYYGWADQALNPRMGVEYYEKVAERMGPETTGFMRLFMAPGMFHCAGGVGPSTFDALTPLIEWVEKGAAPEKIVGARMAAGKPVLTRPLCPYPQVARYKGTGSVDDAGSFVCQKP
ncbi:MAG: tannase/feruloyl esterase family alpha/beta hydrolase [Acidobacteria bacterium]|nr:tannase/feruloyl esterase family alpha/beta hydrolase [Acidobacteriota bacterium]MBI3473926.1 tannase/feruloyl esterase family alpha/beta hydrolase [Candidatus Solibacter usitatus]